jgi:hypothetical protein
MGQALLSAVRDFRGRSPVLDDDESMVVLQQTMDNQASYASQSIESELRTYEPSSNLKAYDPCAYLRQQRFLTGLRLFPPLAKD